MKGKTIGLIIVVILVVVTILILQNPFRESDVVEDDLIFTGNSIGDLAPDFILETPQGNEIQLSSFRGEKPVVINFWASWCPPCWEELPFFQKEYEMGEVEILAVNLQEKNDVQAWFDERGLTMPILLDPNSDVKNIYGVFTQPVTYFIDINGVIQDRKFGQILEEEFQEKLSKIK